MANEAVPIALSPTVNPVRRTCANGTGIEKYTILQLIDANAVLPCSGASAAFGGIAAAEKVASDGSTDIAAFMDGVFDLTFAGTAAIGAAVSISGANLLKTATEAELAAGQFVGYVEEAASPNEVARVRLRGGNL